MSLELTPNDEVLAREPGYRPLKAFQGGGFYWDAAAQGLIRSELGEFLPAVERGNDNTGAYGRFRTSSGGSECVARSRPLGKGQVPADQVSRLQSALARFKQIASAPTTQPDNRILIEKFQLPDPAKDAELYRLVGSHWNPQLQIIWGCERDPGSSISAKDAVDRLPVDRAHQFKRAIPALACLSLLALVATLMWVFWPTRESVQDTSSVPLSTTQMAANQNQVQPASAPLATRGSNEFSVPTALPTNSHAQASPVALTNSLPPVAPPITTAASTNTTTKSATTTNQSVAMPGPPNTPKQESPSPTPSIESAKAVPQPNKPATNAPAVIPEKTAGTEAVTKQSTVPNPAQPNQPPASTNSPKATGSGDSSRPQNDALSPPPSSEKKTPERQKARNIPVDIPHLGTLLMKGFPRAPAVGKAGTQDAISDYQIISTGNHPKGEDGQQEVSLEVRHGSSGNSAIPVIQWEQGQNQWREQSQLKLMLNTGSHPVTALIRDGGGTTRVIGAIIQVELGQTKVIRSEGRVLVLPKKE